MDGFTPTFFLELVIAIGSAGAVYGAIRTDLKHLRRAIDNETRLREHLAAETDHSIHDIRGHVETVNNRVAVIEGRIAQRL